MNSNSDKVEFTTDDYNAGVDTAIGAIKADDAHNNLTAAVYNAQGMRLNGMQQGLNVVLFADGTAQKVFMK